MYSILSNNYINKLIDLSYTTAEKRKIIHPNQDKTLPNTYMSPQIVELVTHFVTFLKSLALRMNAETLQFFLKYSTEQEDGTAASPSHFSKIDSNSNNNDQNNNRQQQDISERSDATPITLEERTSSKVDFPLYDRALQFCAAHHDSFVQTTAMNICLNTLRLTTIEYPDSDPDSPKTQCEIFTTSPDGVLHNAKPLPYRERVTSARHACIPINVEKLIAPIFTKLAEYWSTIDEHICTIDSNKHMGYTDITDEDMMHGTEIAFIIKEKVLREKLIRSYKDKVANLQDELLLLDDVFKVGLTVLNEQTIEMMFATFVYLTITTISNVLSKA